MLTGICSVEKYLLNFMTLIFIGKRTRSTLRKRTCNVGKTQNLSLNVTCRSLEFVNTDSWESSATWPLKVSWRRSYASNDIFIYLFFFRNIRGAQTRPFDPVVRARASIFSLSWSEIHLRGDTRVFVLVLVWEKKIFSLLNLCVIRCLFISTNSR